LSGLSSPFSFAAEDENWTVLDRKEMVSEEAFDDWKKQRTAERSAAKQKQQSPEKVRVSLPPSLPPCPEPFSGVFLQLWPFETLRLDSQ